MNDREETLVGFLIDVLVNDRQKCADEGLVYRGADPMIGISFGYLCAAAGMESERIQEVALRAFRLARLTHEAKEPAV